MMKLPNSLKSQKGAVLAEYALVISILIVVFLTAGILLFNSATGRANVGAEAVRNAVPCSEVEGEGALDADSAECL